MRARRSSTAASSRASTASRSASSSTRDGQRFYDEGEDFWPKRYAIWGSLSRGSPIRSRIRSSTPRWSAASCRRCSRRSSGELDRRARERKLALPADALEATVAALQPRGAARHVRSRGARRLPDRGAAPAEDALGAAHRHAAVLRLPAPARHHLHLPRVSRSTDGAACVMAGRHAGGERLSPPARSWPATSCARATWPASA